MESKERLIQRYTTTQKACDALGEIIEIINKDRSTFDESYERAFRDSLIQRFEFAYDTFWKFIKDILKEKFDVEEVSPRTVFREAFSYKLISNKESGILLEMLADRNITSHIYKEEIADIISTRIPEYYEILCSILMRLNPELDT